ncbi:hypothetical protein KA057_00050 [Candidatus Gracilibacteria bacterium]|nr:hypothetical protein [Candidatus Gracilibacteria bacterium]
MNEFMPIVAQDYQTGDVRMVGVGNEESIAVSDNTGNLTFWSRTKGRLWTKGETSGDFLEIQDKQNTVCMSQDRQLQESIVYRVKQVVGETGMTCHKGTPTCFGGEEFDIKNRLALKRLDYAKMNGKILVITQATPSNGIVGVRMLDESNVKYLLRNLSERSGGRGGLSIDCDNDTLLIRVPTQIAITAG